MESKLHVRPVIAGCGQPKNGQALGLARHYRECGEEAEVLAHLADIELARRDVTAARRLYSEASELAKKLEMRPLIARCHLGIGRASHAAGLKVDAQRELQKATTMFREMGMTYWLEKLESELQARS